MKMTVPQFLNCTGFDENVVLTVKQVFSEADLRQIVIEKFSGDREETVG